MAIRTDVAVELLERLNLDGLDDSARLRMVSQNQADHYYWTRTIGQVTAGEIRAALISRPTPAVSATVADGLSESQYTEILISVSQTSLPDDAVKLAEAQKLNHHDTMQLGWFQCFLTFKSKFDAALSRHTEGK